MYLKSTKTGLVYTYTDILAKRPDMVVVANLAGDPVPVPVVEKKEEETQKVVTKKVSKKASKADKGE